jgi:hypothetical protein
MRIANSPTDGHCIPVTLRNSNPGIANYIQKRLYVLQKICYPIQTLHTTLILEIRAEFGPGDLREKEGRDVHYYRFFRRTQIQH